MRNVSGNALTLYGAKEVSDVFYLCKILPDTYNFTSNFTIISGSGRNMLGNTIGIRSGFPISQSYTGTADDFDYTAGTMTMDANPTTFITGVHLYNEHGMCIATATLSRPWKKDYNREIVIKVKLSY